MQYEPNEIFFTNETILKTLALPVSFDKGKQYERKYQQHGHGSPYCI